MREPLSNWRLPTGWLLHEGALFLITAVFLLLNSLALGMVQSGQRSWSLLWPFVIWLFTYAPLYWLLARHRPHHDRFILPIISLLTGWGILLMARLAPNFLLRQVVWMVLGTAVLGAIALLPRSLSWLRQYRYSWLTAGLLLLGATLLFGVNPSGANSANYWLQIPFLSRVFLQPSELLKLLLVIFFASYFDQQEPLLRRAAGVNGRFHTLRLIAPLLLMWGFSMLLLVWQQDLGAATLFFFLFLGLLYLATGDQWLVIGGFALLLLAGIIAYNVFDVVALRVDAWWNPWPDADGRAFQIVQSLYAVASGGLVGQGIGQGFPDYIPVVHSDFAFAAIAEEWGLVGSLVVVCCMALLAHRGLRIALRSQRPFNRYLAVGITLLLATQAILIMGGVTKLLPLTGVTLPFVSYGGSSMLVSHMMVGLLLFLSTTAETSAPVGPHTQAISRLHLGMMIAFGLVALSLTLWATVRATAVLSREDNPRQVEAQLRVQRGRIVDASGNVLAETIGEGNQLRRIYPIDSIGPAVGYYSFRHGTTGVESGYNQLLSDRPEPLMEALWRQWLHQPEEGLDIRLTLEARWQQVADQLLGDRQGGLLFLQESVTEAETFNVLAMVSHPVYDPNRLDEQFDQLIADESSPLLNRVTQGAYQPGMVLQPFLLATAVQQSPTFLGEPLPVAANTAVVFNGSEKQCAVTPPVDERLTWADMLTYRCPAPMAALTDSWGVGGLDQAFYDLGFTQPISLSVDIEPVTAVPIADPQLAGIGQDTLTLTPLQVSRVWAALVTNGRLPNLRLVSDVRTPDGEWQPAPANAFPPEPEALSAQAVREIQRLLPSPREGLLEFSSSALSGPDAAKTTWYLGRQTVNGRALIVVVVLENETAVGEIEQIGRGLLSAFANQAASSP